MTQAGLLLWCCSRHRCRFARPVAGLSRLSVSARSSSNWSSTVNVPNTDFSHYPQSDFSWEQKLQQSGFFSSLYSWQREQPWSSEFVLQDGPPYANGEAHMGHAVNRVLKDIILRYKVMQKTRVRFRPGWDCHGLPIELRALSQSLDGQSCMEPLAIRSLASEFAAEAVDLQRAAFSRWGLMTDWSSLYRTCDKHYVARQLQLFAKLHQLGYVFRDLKPIFWSPSSRTALAEAELEYNTSHVSRTAYVRLPVTEHPFTGCGNVYLMVWTTTPWSLPANQAVCFSADLEYVLAQFEGLDGDYLVAKQLCDRLSAVLGRRLLRTAAVSLANSRCCYTLPAALSRQGTAGGRLSLPLLPSDHVTVLQGTGLVHAAPSHGREDFQLAEQHDITPLVLVDEKGCYNELAPQDLVGRSVLGDGTALVLDKLGEDVLKVENYRHSYPYDWRTKQPVITVASHQWFIDTPRLLQPALEALESVSVLPNTIESLLTKHLKLRTFWCISRQRSWGVPIPAFYDQHQTPVIDSEIISHLVKLFQEHGTDIWWTWSVADLLPPSKLSLYDPAHLPTKGKDIMDVWLDSGSAWFATQEDAASRPADLCVEGIDQFNGWFLTSLLTSVACTGRSPYRSLLVHGFVLDADGRKMSKSLGNVIDPSTVLDGNRRQEGWPPRGPDCLRQWVACHACGNSHIALSNRALQASAERLLKLRNTFRFLLGMQRHLTDEFATTRDAGSVLRNARLIDRFMMYKLGKFVEECAELYEKYHFNRAMLLIHNFVVKDVSSLYLSIIKSRLYASDVNDVETQCSLYVMRQIMLALRQVTAPVLPHLSEEVRAHDPLSTEESVFHCGWPCVQHTGQSDRLETVTVTALLSLREAILQLVANRNSNLYEAQLRVVDSTPLALAVQITHPAGERCFLSQLAEIMPVAWVTVLAEGEGGAEAGGAGGLSEDCGDGGADQPVLTCHVDGVAVSLFGHGSCKCARCYRHTAAGELQLCSQCAQLMQSVNAQSVT